MSRLSTQLCLCLLVLALGGCNILGSLLGVAVPLAGAKLPFACIPEGTLIDTPSGPRPIESLQAGEPVIGFDGAAVRVLQKHCYAEDPELTEFLAVRFASGASVDLCGMHRISGIRARNLSVGEPVAGIVVERIGRYRGVIRSYDLLTEDLGYRIGGVPVNSMIEEMYRAGRSGRFPVDD